MRLPEKVNICGKTYRVCSGNTLSSSGDTFKQKVNVGTKGQTDERIFENYLHEIAELAACEQAVRFMAADDEVVFVMTHKQFTGFVNDVSTAILPMIKCQ